MNTDDIKVSHIGNRLTIDLTGISERVLHIDIDILKEKIIIRQDMETVKQIIHSELKGIEIKHGKNQTFADVNIQGVTESPCAIKVTNFDTRNLIIDVVNNDLVEINNTTVLSTLYVDQASKLYLLMSYIKVLSIEENRLDVLQITKSTLNDLNGDKLLVGLLGLGIPNSCNLCDVVMDNIHAMGVSPKTKLHTTDARINAYFPESNVVMCVKQSNETISINNFEFPEQMVSYLLTELV